MGKRRTLRIAAIGSILLPWLLVTGVQARPTTPQEARLAVAGWLAGAVRPLEAPLGHEIAGVQSVAGAMGEPVYYVVRLHPAGLVIVPADDLVEPILSFTAGADEETPAPDPLTALVRADVGRRLAEAYAAVTGQLQAQAATRNQARWHDLMGRTGLPASVLAVQSLETVADVRVAPFLTTQWAQTTVCDTPCYNYFTPQQYPCGCAATTMAQLMYYYRQPAAGIGRQSFTIAVGHKAQPAWTRGGDGSGGPYRWADLPPVPDCNVTVAQRQALGALSYDAGLAVQMDYSAEGSSADGFALAPALKNTFRFSNAISGANQNRDLGLGLPDMVNPNLDAGYPVILGLLGKTGHAVLTDGYGYDTSTRVKTLYHHLNMGWAGRNDVWYNLPEVGKYDTVLLCIYNIYAAGAGEIVSGRVTDPSGRPLSGVTVATYLGTTRAEATTNARGIYALPQLPSACLFTVAAARPGYAFVPQTVATGTSRDYAATAGNRWGIDFVAIPGAATGSGTRKSMTVLNHAMTN
ncbi:MAG: C10 family peptidase [Planctomycetes bacterium]|nr:C10 family peptidase [Planctomycetota bacterium]